MELPDVGLLMPAFVAGILVSVSHAILGREVIRRGIIFLDLAVAQVAALGALAALQTGAGSLAVQGASFAAALICAACLTVIERRWPVMQEALIGTVFVLSATAGLLLLAHDPHGGDALRDVLAGQILWTSWASLQVSGIAMAILVACLLAGWGDGQRSFYFLFALAITLSVQWVGLYLVFSSLVMPALAVRALPRRPAVLLASALGTLGYGAGLCLSWYTDLPAGPLIVWCLAVVCLISAGVLRQRV